ncbi:MAG: glycosyltransferase [Anaerovoracaceae bacterium]
MKRLFVFTQQYPYGTSEPFIANETAYWDGFDQVYLCPLAVKLQDRQIERAVKSKNTTVIDLRYDTHLGIHSLPAVFHSLFSKAFVLEIMQMLCRGHFNKYNLKRLLSLSVHTRAQIQLLKIWFKDHEVSFDDDSVLYGYWLYEPALATVLLKKSMKMSKTVNRAHGFDIYEERSNGYIPYRKLFLSLSDKIYPISENGRDYLAKRYPKYAKKIAVSRLGTVDYGMEPPVRNSMVLEIVSCSYCIQVKRIEKMIQALALMKNDGLKLHWTHFGDGPLLDKLKAVATDELTGNISFTFAGQISNVKLMEIYKDGHFDVFINVSESEGIPVSIMEAMSFGIPAIATDVGGTNELVIQDKTGYLLPKDFAPDELNGYLKKIAALSDDLYQELRMNARSYWMQNYSAKNNYKRFMDELKE